MKLSMNHPLGVYNNSHRGAQPVPLELAPFVGINHNGGPHYRAKINFTKT